MSTEMPDWSKIPTPEDDGAARHLLGMRVPSIGLPSTRGNKVDLAALDGRTVVYVYPRTGRPGVENPDGWDSIPGARGCSPRSRAFRDHFAALKRLGVDHLFGVSTQSTECQREAAERLRLPFPLLSDQRLGLTRAWSLPTFETAGTTLLKRLTLIIRDSQIRHVFYPVFPPDENAAEVVAWLSDPAHRAPLGTAGVGGAGIRTCAPSPRAAPRAAPRS